jgi:hypothetical protein
MPVVRKGAGLRRGWMDRSIDGQGREESKRLSGGRERRGAGIPKSVFHHGSYDLAFTRQLYQLGSQSPTATEQETRVLYLSCTYS